MISTVLSVQDGTLCTFKDPKRKFAMGSDDWRLYNATVPAKIQQLRDEGYTIVVFRCLWLAPQALR